jgi:hypothetical protein
MNSTLSTLLSATNSVLSGVYLEVTGAKLQGISTLYTIAFHIE